MAAAAAQFGEMCLRAMGGEAGVTVCAYVSSSVTSLPFFSSRCGHQTYKSVLYADQTPPCAVTLFMLYLYLVEWNPRVWDMYEVYNPMYPTSSHLELGGALKRLLNK
eukprot:1190248-Prorocentrum_minimum.AAC.3